MLPSCSRHFTPSSLTVQPDRGGRGDGSRWGSVMSSPVPGAFCHVRVPANPNIVTCRGEQGKRSVPAHTGSSHLKPTSCQPLHSISQSSPAHFRHQSQCTKVTPKGYFLVCVHFCLCGSFSFFTEKALPLFVQSKGHFSMCVTYNCTSNLNLRRNTIEPFYA